MAARAPNTRLRFKDVLPSLKTQIDQELGGVDDWKVDVARELVRAMLYLWLYFEEQCAIRAHRVRGIVCALFSHRYFLS